MSAAGRISFAAAATRSCPGPITTATAPPVARTAASTCASSVRPPMACSTFGREDRMRVPSPAASTIVRQVLSPMPRPTPAVLITRAAGSEKARPDTATFTLPATRFARGGRETGNMSAPSANGREDRGPGEGQHKGAESVNLTAGLAGRFERAGPDDAMSGEDDGDKIDMRPLF